MAEPTSMEALQTRLLDESDPGERAGVHLELGRLALRDGRLESAARHLREALFLNRSLDAARDLSSARMRWEIASAPSPAPRWNPQAPGAPRWRADLFRARAHAPGEWVLGEGGDGLAAQRPARAADHDGGDTAASWTAGLRQRPPPRRA